MDQAVLGSKGEAGGYLRQPVEEAGYGIYGGYQRGEQGVPPRPG
jgi:hypothetical protein